MNFAELNFAIWGSNCENKFRENFCRKNFCPEGNLKTEVDKLDVDKLTPVPDDLAKLSNVVKNDVKLI